MNELRRHTLESLSVAVTPVLAADGISRTGDTDRVPSGGPFDPEQAVMRAVIAQRNAWVPHLLGCFAGHPTEPWRLTAEDLGREGELEEALCIYIDSIYDFGPRISFTPQALVMTFGHVEPSGEVTYGGPPLYEVRTDGRGDYFASGERNPKVCRPTEEQASRWLSACLDGPDVPLGASDEIMMSCLAAAVGLDWQALWEEHARRLGLVPLDDVGEPLPEPPPHTWDLAQARQNVRRLSARRALYPVVYAAWLAERDFEPDDLELSYELEEDRARNWTPLVSAALSQVAVGAASEAYQVSGCATPPRLVNFRTYTAMPDPRRIPPREYVIYPRLSRGDLVSVIGMPGMSKSAFGLFDCVVIASGEERILRGEGNISPERLHEAGPAIFYDAEDALLDMERRLTAMMGFYGLSALRHPLTLISGVGSGPLWIARRNAETRALVEAEGAALLRKWIVETGAIYAVLGPLAGLAEGVDENAVADLNLVAQILTNIGAETGCCINVIHHTSKSGGAEAGDMNAARGSSAFAAKVRGMTTLTALPEAEAQRLGCTGRGYFVATPAKSNHAPRSDGGVVFKRESVPVGNGVGFADDRRDAFEMPARELLRAEGERVQVLRVVGLLTSEPREAAREKKRAAVEDGISAAILDVMGGVDRRPLTDMMSELITQLTARDVIRAKAPATVRERLKAHLGECGKVAEHDGQDVLIRLVKTGPKEKDPWMMVVEPVSEGMSESRSNIAPDGDVGDVGKHPSNILQV